MGATTANTEQLFTGKVFTKTLVLTDGSAVTEQCLVDGAEIADGLRIDSITADYNGTADIEMRFWLKRPDNVLVRQGVVKVDGGAGSTSTKAVAELLERWRGAKRTIQSGYSLYVQMVTAIPANMSLHLTLDGGLF